MAYFKVSGSIYETFGFPLDKKIYDYFAKNNIKLSDYLSDLYKKEDAPNVPEEYDFLQSDENGRGSLYSIWDAFLGSFDGRTTIELYNEEEEVIWESTLDLSSMLWDDMQCEEDKEFVDNIRSSMSEDKCLLTGEITQDYSERLIYLDDEDIEDAVSAYKQELITNGLDDEHSGGSKAASEKQIDEAADSLLESITVK